MGNKIQKLGIHNDQNSIKNFCYTNYKEKNQSIEMDPEITETLNFAYKDLKTAIISMPKI